MGACTVSCEGSGADAETAIDLLRQNHFSFVISNPREPDNPIVYASDEFFTTTGYHPTQVLGRNCRFLQGPRTSKQAVMEVRDAIREERSCSVVLLNYRKNGEPFWNAFTLYPVQEDNGCVLFYVGIQTDISSLISSDVVDETEVHHVAEAKLAQAEALAHDVSQCGMDLLSRSRSKCAVDNSIPSSLVTCLSRIAGSFSLTNPNLPDNPMVFCSPGFLQMVGYDSSELVGRNCRMLQGPDTEQDAVAVLRKAVAEGRPATVTLTNYRKDGSAFRNCVHVVPIRDAAGRLQFLCGVQLDLSTANNKEAVLAKLSLSDVPPEGKLDALREPSDLELLEQKGVVGAVRVAARALSVCGLRRERSDQHTIGS